MLCREVVLFQRLCSDRACVLCLLYMKISTFHLICISAAGQSVLTASQLHVHSHCLNRIVAGSLTGVLRDVQLALNQIFGQVRLCTHVYSLNFEL